MKVSLSRELISGMLQLMADCGQQEFDADIEDVGDGKGVLRYVLEDGKLKPFSASTVVRDEETPTPAPEPEVAPEVSPEVDKTDATALLALKIADLQAIAASMGLSSDGKKPELVNSIVDEAKRLSVEEAG